MEEYNKIRMVLPYEGGIDIEDIEEILRDKPTPTQIDSYQLVKAVIKK